MFWGKYSIKFILVVEKRAFGTMYDNTTNDERPKYGVINIKYASKGEEGALDYGTQ